MVRIILNADDFGRSLTLNQAVNDSFKQGLISSASLIVTGKYLQNAVDYINAGDYVEKVHLHFNVSTILRDGDSEDMPLTKAMKEDTFFCKNGKFSTYKGLPQKFSYIRKWKVVYRELVAQYEKFIEITKGKADYKHVDFHLWYNLTWPVSVALYFFNRKYKIESIRLIGLHQMNSRKYRLLTWISKTRNIKEVPSTNIDYYLTKKKSLSHYQTIELYCHPNYKNGEFLDDSPSYLHHDRQPMLRQIQMLKDSGDIEFISWKDILET